MPKFEVSKADEKLEVVDTETNELNQLEHGKRFCSKFHFFSQSGNRRQNVR